MAFDLENTDLSTFEAVMETDKGTMTLRFYSDVAPNTVRNFLKLSQEGFYDGLVFHRIIKGFMIQGGCPKGTGTGGPGYQIDAEFNDKPHRRGVLSMARAQDPNSAGSQFFIVHAEHASHLDGQYTAFGFVEDGLDVLDQLASVETTFGPGGEQSKPTEPVHMRKVEVRQIDAGGADQ